MSKETLARKVINFSMISPQAFDHSAGQNNSIVMNTKCNHNISDLHRNPTFSQTIVYNLIPPMNGV